MTMSRNDSIANSFNLRTEDIQSFTLEKKEGIIYVYIT